MTLDSTNFKKMKKEVEEFFKQMTFDVEIELLPQRDQTLPVNLKTENPQILIGERGETLLDIQHLLKAILKRKAGIKELFYVDLDINDYKKKKIAYLKEMARSATEEVVLTKKEKILPPMPAYERRIIHLELADNSNITTESVGQEPERRIVIRPCP
jgi:spoIIIJ-associated protein